MTDTTKTEALRLAKWACARIDPTDIGREIAAELRRLSAVEAERDRLAAECERTSNNRDMWKEQVSRQAAELEKLRAECEALRADAERYQAIKASLYAENITIGEAYLTLRVVGVCPDVSEWDAAIDAAMGGKESKGGQP